MRLSCRTLFYKQIKTSLLKTLGRDSSDKTPKYSIVKPGQLSPYRYVPGNIVKPSYAEKGMCEQVLYLHVSYYYYLIFLLELPYFKSN